MFLVIIKNSPSFAQNSLETGILFGWRKLDEIQLSFYEEESRWYTNSESEKCSDGRMGRYMINAFYLSSNLTL